jgi:hypothetical protein
MLNNIVKGSEQQKVTGLPETFRPVKIYAAGVLYCLRFSNQGGSSASPRLALQRADDRSGQP